MTWRDEWAELKRVLLPFLLAFSVAAQGAGLAAAALFGAWLAALLAVTSLLALAAYRLLPTRLRWALVLGLLPGSWLMLAATFRLLAVR